MLESSTKTLSSCLMTIIAFQQRTWRTRLESSRKSRGNCNLHREHENHSEGDADMLIVKTAIKSAKETNTVLNTDLLVLLCFYTHLDGFDLNFMSEPKANSRRWVWNMKVKEQLGHDVCHNLLFLHAILGCDTTSRVYGNWQSGGLKEVCQLDALQRTSEGLQLAFHSQWCSVSRRKCTGIHLWWKALGETWWHVLPVLLWETGDQEFPNTASEPAPNISSSLLS